VIESLLCKYEAVPQKERERERREGGKKEGKRDKEGREGWREERKEGRKKQAVKWWPRG
jgi:hypothetical protein